jgi:hypothetical protein
MRYAMWQYFSYAGQDVAYFYTKLTLVHVYQNLFLLGN